MPVPRKSAAADPLPASDEVVITVTGSTTVLGVKPGGVVPWDGDLERLRWLVGGGYVTCTVGGVEIGDGHIVAKMEGA